VRIQNFEVALAFEHWYFSLAGQLDSIVHEFIEVLYVLLTVLLFTDYPGNLDALQQVCCSTALLNTHHPVVVVNALQR